MAPNMVKTTLDNGVQHPDIAVYDSAADTCQVLRHAIYLDDNNRLS